MFLTRKRWGGGGEIPGLIFRYNTVCGILDRVMINLLAFYQERCSVWLRFSLSILL